MNRDVALGQLSITLCTESFWPYFDAFSWWACDFCRLVPKADCSVRVVTTRPTRDNPVEFQWHGVEVQRIFKRPLAQFNWFRSSKEWRQVLTRQSSHDCLLINQTARSAIRTLNLAKRLKIPAVLRVNERWLEDEKSRPKAEQIFAAAQRMKEQIRVVFSSPSVQNEFKIADGIQCEAVEDGVIASDPCFENDHQTGEIRKSLADAHPIFQMNREQPLVLAAPFFGLDPTAKQLVSAWVHVRQRFPEARLWLSGDGPGARDVWNTICRYELNQEAIMHGQFDQLYDLCRAADLVVVFQDQFDSSSRFLKLALASGTSVLVEKSPAHDLLTADFPEAIHFENLDASGLANRIMDFFERIGEQKNSTTDNSRPAEVAEKHQFRQTVEQYISIVRDLVESAGRSL